MGGAHFPNNKINIQYGDIVLVISNAPRSEWPIGHVVSAHAYSQGVLRIVKIQCKGFTTLKT